ncbi:hypothetical protein EUTSA_v10009622mg, partial [Eutrema salsugineum]
FLTLSSLYTFQKTFDILIVSSKHKMEGRRYVSMINGGGGRERRSRPIPKRGQVKVGILIGFANSFASILGFTRNFHAP